MEQTYKTALEIILNLLKKDEFADRKVIQLVCETALKEREEEEI